MMFVGKVSVPVGGGCVNRITASLSLQFQKRNDVSWLLEYWR